LAANPPTKDMDPITIGAFLASAGSSLVGGLLGSSAAKAQGQAAKASYQVSKQASKTQKKQIDLEKKAAIAAGKIEWKAGLLDFDASLTEGEAAGLMAASEMFNILLDAENVARGFEADSVASEFNARVANQMARNSISVADAEARDYRLRGNAAVESQRAQQAGSGFMMEGSPMLVQEVLFSEVELGTARLKHAGEVEATRLRTEGELLQYSAGIDKQSANIAREMSKINAGYAAEAGKIRLDAAFLSGDRAMLSLESANLGINTAVQRAMYLQQARAQSLKATAIQTNAAVKGAKLEGISSIVSGVGNAAGTIANSGMFG
jgi:hypothetical protein